MHRSILRACALSLAALLCACASGPKQLYEGARRPASGESLLTIAEPLEIIRIDDSRFPSLFTSGGRQVALLPGEHEVVVRLHVSFTTEGGEEEAVISQAYVLGIDLEAGGRYTLDTPEPDSLMEARRNLVRPEIWLLNLTTKERRDFDLEGQGRSMREAISRPHTEKKKVVAQPAEAAASATPATLAVPSTPSAPEARSPASGEAAAAGTDEKSKELDELEDWWHRASDQDRERFRKQIEASEDP